MSQKPSAPHPASRSPSDGRNITLPPVQLHHDLEPAGRRVEGAEGQYGYGTQPSRHIVQPLTAQVSQGMSPEDDRSTSRGLGMHSILNPTEPEGGRRFSPHLSGGPARSPQSLGPQPQLPPPPTSEYGDPRTNSPSQFREGQASQSSKGRKILIPKSPRAISLGGRGMPPTMINAQETPFLGDRSQSYASQPGPPSSTDAPTLPLISGAPQPQFTGFPPPAQAPALSRRASVATMGGTGRSAPLSQSASPTPSYSSYSGPGQHSPRYQTGPPPIPSTSAYFPGSSLSAPFQGSSPSQTAPPQEGAYMNPLPESMFYRGSPGGTHSSAIRMMPISTEHGPVFMPVDVQAASKVADEKRARNAGASARFRQRRKEKEREANTSISKLEQQKGDLERKMKDLEHERDFYRTERDRFRDIVYRTPATRDYAIQAPPSPRHTRPSGLAPPPPPPAGTGYQTSEIGTPVEQERPPRRRRTDTLGDYTYPGPPQPPTDLPPVPNPSFGRGPGPGSVQSPPNLPPLRLENVTGPPSSSIGASPHPPAAISGPPPFDPYPPRPAYERPWPGAPPGPSGGGESGQRS